MSPRELIFYAVLIAVGTFAVILALHAIRAGVGAYRIRRAGPRPLHASHNRIWRECGVVEELDLKNGPGGPDGAPTPTFTFLEEHTNGSQPCVSVRDARGRRWRVKWGDEVHSETFAVRVAWACGYFAEVTHFIASGVIENAVNLQRAQACIEAGTGRFDAARFELDDPEVHKLFEEHSWSWTDNPFVGTQELSGLKIVMMLLSNWDSKDRRDVSRGSNTAIFEVRGTRPGNLREARYLVIDWGGSMGKWGSNVVTRGRWDPDGFEAQTPQFVTGVHDGWVGFGYTGQRTDDIARNITLEHARWFYAIASRLTERQLIEALAASGASDEEQVRFARAVRARIAQLRLDESARISNGPTIG